MSFSEPSFSSEPGLPGARREHPQRGGEGTEAADKALVPFINPAPSGVPVAFDFDFVAFADR